MGCLLWKRIKELKMVSKILELDYRTKSIFKKINNMRINLGVHRKILQRRLIFETIIFALLYNFQLYFAAGMWFSIMFMSLFNLSKVEDIITQTQKMVKDFQEKKSKIDKNNNK